MSVVIRQSRFCLIVAAIFVAAFFLAPEHASAVSPTINPVYPIDGQIIPWHKPVVSVAVTGLNADPGSIELKLDDQPTAANFDPISGCLTFAPAGYLSTGRHDVYLKVGNIEGQTSELAWDFTVKTLVSSALHSGGSLEVSGNAFISGDTYSYADTAIFGSPTIAGNGYATGMIRWDGFSSAFLGMPYSNASSRDFPEIDFDYYKSLAQAQGQAYVGKLHLTKKKPLSGVIFVDGDLKISGGTHNITAVVTGEVKISDKATVSSFADSMLIIAKEEIEVSGRPSLSGVIYSQTDEVEVKGGAALSGAIVAKKEIAVSGHMTAIDALAPAPPALDQPASPTKQTPVDFTGDAEAYSVVEIIEGVQVVATDTADSTGRFSIPAELPEGPHNIIAVAIDSAGNVSEPSGGCAGRSEYNAAAN